MAKREERVMVAEILDPVPDEVSRELTAREWILEPGEDTEGQTFKRLGQTEEDVEGHLIKHLRPADKEDTEGQFYKRLRPIEGEDDDVVGLLFKRLDQGDDTEGQIKIRVRPKGAQPEDTSGHWLKRLGQGEEDVEGQIHVRFVKTD